MSDSHPDLARAQSLHQQLEHARRAHRRAEYHLACLLRELDESRLYQLLGFSTITDYAHIALDLEPRHARDLVRLGRRLPDLPRVDQALAEGTLGWTKAREIIRVVTPETENAWLERAFSVTSRELEADVARAVIGEGPPIGEPRDPRGSARRRVVLEMEATDAEALFQAIALVRAHTNTTTGEVENGAAIAAIARRFLEAADSEQDAPTSEPYRVVLEQCPTCGHTAGVDADVTETIAEESVCDAEVIDMTPGPTRGHATKAIPPSVRRAVLHRDGWSCGIPHCRCKLWLHVHHLVPRSRGGTHDEKNLLNVCSVHHRLIHEGVLSVERLEDGRIVVEHADGRRVVGSRPTHRQGERTATHPGRGPRHADPRG